MAAISILAGGIFGMISALIGLVFFEIGALGALGIWSLCGFGFAALTLVFALAARSVGTHSMASKTA